MHVCGRCNEIPLNVYEKFMTRANGAKTSWPASVWAKLNGGKGKDEWAWPLKGEAGPGRPGAAIAWVKMMAPSSAGHAALHAKYVMKGIRTLYCVLPTWFCLASMVWWPVGHVHQPERPISEQVHGHGRLGVHVITEMNPFVC